MPTDADLLRRWPDTLLEQIARRNFFLVLGAGASANARNSLGVRPPTWTELLERLGDAFLNQIADKKHLKRMLKQGRLLDAAEMLRLAADRDGKGNDFVRRIVDEVDSPRDGGFEPDDFFDHVLDLQPATIVTTNYDRVLERAAKTGFTYLSGHSPDIGRSVRTGVAVALALHGSVQEPTKIVLSRTDYSRLRVESSHALEVVQSLFMTKTALMIGYSLNDPDMQLLLENVLGARGGPPAHYMLSLRLADFEVSSLRCCYGVAPVLASSLGEMKNMIKLLSNDVTGRRSAYLAP